MADGQWPTVEDAGVSWRFLFQVSASAWRLPFIGILGGRLGFRAAAGKGLFSVFWSVCWRPCFLHPGAGLTQPKGRFTFRP